MFRVLCEICQISQKNFIFSLCLTFDSPENIQTVYSSEEHLINSEVPSVLERESVAHIRIQA